MPRSNQEIADDLDEAIDDARDNRGDWLVEIEDIVDELAAIGQKKLTRDLRGALSAARDNRGDWLARLDFVADDLRQLGE